MQILVDRVGGSEVKLAQDRLTAFRRLVTRIVASLRCMGEPRPVHRWLTVAALMSGGGAAAACEPTVQLQMPEPLNHIVEGLADVPAHRSVTIGDILVCVSSPGAVTITSITPVRPIGQMRVQAFAVRPNPSLNTPPGDLVANAKGSLSRAHFGKSRRVDAVCGSRPGAGYEVGLQLVKLDAEPAATAGWLIRYRSGGQEGTLTVPLGVVLCSQPSAEAPECKRLTERVMV